MTAHSNVLKWIFVELLISFHLCLIQFYKKLKYSSLNILTKHTTNLDTIVFTCLHLTFFLSRKYNLDVYIEMAYAPGYSAYSYVERRMAPLSRVLANLVLPHISCDTHLDDSGKAIDIDLEK